MPTNKTSKKTPRKNANKVGRPALGKPGTHKTYTFLAPIKDIKKLRSIANKRDVTVSFLLRDAIEVIISKN